MIRHLQDVNNGGWGIFIEYDKYLHFVKSEKWIAAFLILYRKYSNVTVVLGTNDLSRVDNRTMRYNVKKCKHRDYKNVLLGNDIMMLKVRTSFFKTCYICLCIDSFYKILSLSNWMFHVLSPLHLEITHFITCLFCFSCQDHQELNQSNFPTRRRRSKLKQHVL